MMRQMLLRKLELQIMDDEVNHKNTHTINNRHLTLKNVSNNYRLIVRRLELRWIVTFVYTKMSIG